MFVISSDVPDFFVRKCIRGNFKYYFADFVRKGGGGTPQIRNSFFAENFVRKGGEGGTPQIRKKKTKIFLGGKVRKGRTM